MSRSGAIACALFPVAQPELRDGGVLDGLVALHRFLDGASQDGALESGARRNDLPVLEDAHEVLVRDRPVEALRVPTQVVLRREENGDEPPADLGIDIAAAALTVPLGLSRLRGGVDLVFDEDCDGLVSCPDEDLHVGFAGRVGSRPAATHHLDGLGGGGIDAIQEPADELRRRGELLPRAGGPRRARKQPRWRPEANRNSRSDPTARLLIPLPARR